MEHVTEEPALDIEVADLARIPGTGGVVWSAGPAGCHVNLVVLEPGRSIAAHRNDVVDVQVVVVAGPGTAHVADEVVPLAAMTTLTIPRGATRRLDAGDGGMRYLTIHAERSPLTIGSVRDV